MDYIENVEDLAAFYGTPSTPAQVKVTPCLTPAYRAWIERSRFCVVSTVGPEGTDASPRGDDGQVVRVLDATTLALPDWRGNERIDTLRNIVRDPRVSLMFFVPGSNNVIRVNGRARITADSALCASFTHEGKMPRTVIVIKIAEVYSQCARAIMRARLWTSGDDSTGLPTMGEILQEITKGDFDGATYDAEWPGRAARTLW